MEARPPSAGRRAGKVLAQLLLTGLVTWFILRAVGVNLGKLGSFDLSTLHIRWVVLAVASSLLVAAYLYAASLWGLMVRELSGVEMGLVASLRVFFTANLGRYLPGKVWQIAGLALLARKEGVPAATASGAAVLGQAFSLAGATLVGAGVLLRSEWGDLGAMVVLGGLLACVAVPGILRALMGLWFRLSREAEPPGLELGAAFGVRWMGLYALAWLMQGGAFLVLGRSLGMALPPLEALAAYPAAYVLGYVAVFAPAGIGVREGFLIAFLDPILGTGAAALAVIARLWTTAVELLLALLLMGGHLGSRWTGGRARG